MRTYSAHRNRIVAFLLFIEVVKMWLTASRWQVMRMVLMHSSALSLITLTVTTALGSRQVSKLLATGMNEFWNNVVSILMVMHASRTT
jgi:hypothetical protein